MVRHDFVAIWHLSPLKSFLSVQLPTSSCNTYRVLILLECLKQLTFSCQIVREKVFLLMFESCGKRLSKLYFPNLHRRWNGNVHSLRLRNSVQRLHSNSYRVWQKGSFNFYVLKSIFEIHCWPHRHFCLRAFFSPRKHNSLALILAPLLTCTKGKTDERCFFFTNFFQMVSV